jgi:hypothetical protein
MRRQLQFQMDEPSERGGEVVFSVELQLQQQQLVNLMAHAILAVVLPERSACGDADSDQRQG